MSQTNTTVLYVVLAVLGILAVAFALVSCALGRRNRQLGHELQRSKNSASADDANTQQAHYENAHSSVLFSPNYYYDSHADESRGVVESSNPYYGSE